MYISVYLTHLHFIRALIYNPTTLTKSCQDYNILLGVKTDVPVKRNNVRETCLNKL